MEREVGIVAVERMRLNVWSFASEGEGEGNGGRREASMEESRRLVVLIKSGSVHCSLVC